MAYLNGQNVCDEVAFRIANRLPANGSGAGSIINFVNDAYGLIEAAASWFWDVSIYNAVTPTFIMALGQYGYEMAGGVDFGKKISCFNTTTHAPIVRIMQDEIESASAGYTNADATWNAFSTVVNPVTINPVILFFPYGMSGMVDIYVHLAVASNPLIYGSFPTVRWNIAAMDMLLKDWATAQTMKYLNMSGWDTLWADCMGRLGEFRRMYTTERENMGPEDEAPKVVQEKATVGRV